MRKVLCFLMLLLATNSFIVSAAEKKEDIPLTGGNSEKYDKNTPRNLIPLSCYYEEGVVSLNVWGDLGAIQLSVTNQLTGETEVNVNGTLSVNVPTASGTYIVQIVTEDGTWYYGTYTL